MDQTALMDFVTKAVGDAGGLLAGSMVVLGDRLGFYHAMAGAGPMTVASSLPSRAPSSGTCGNGCQPRPRRATSPTWGTGSSCCPTSTPSR